MKVAAYQSPLGSCYSSESVALVRDQVARCEALGVEILCCAEGVVGGLADYASSPAGIAIDAGRGQLQEVLAPLASTTVATIVGFTEIDDEARLFNAAAVFHRGVVAGVYRKLHPAINRSIYAAGCEMPVFTIGALTFGVLICRDSTYPAAAASLASKGAVALFVPTNNGMPSTKGGADLVVDARSTDIARARENGVSVIRADVAGKHADLVSPGSTAIVDREGILLGSARRFTPDLVVAEIDVTPRTNELPHTNR